ncbi:hypothetical protein E2C01_031391 [Portunus trituberculatus]|uniref:Uncharacterized protein n=1 Tax=Portunus trituberculatus TaxID=210409 RepID=A0A5B7EWP4_PORTR|nr:hypothetical protein [Portunus trituberculatus]
MRSLYLVTCSHLYLTSTSRLPASTCLTQRQLTLHPRKVRKEKRKDKQEEREAVSVIVNWSHRPPPPRRGRSTCPQQPHPHHPYLPLTPPTPLTPTLSPAASPPMCLVLPWLTDTSVHPHTTTPPQHTYLTTTTDPNATSSSCTPSTTTTIHSLAPPYLHSSLSPPQRHPTPFPSVSPAGLPSETQPGGQFRLARAPRTHKLRAISSSHASARHSGHRYTHADPPAAPRPRDGPSAGQWATPERRQVIIPATHEHRYPPFPSLSLLLLFPLPPVASRELGGAGSEDWTPGLAAAADLRRHLLQRDTVCTPALHTIPIHSPCFHYPGPCLHSYSHAFYILSAILCTNITSVCLTHTPIHAPSLPSIPALLPFRLPSSNEGYADLSLDTHPRQTHQSN